MHTIKCQHFILSHLKSHANFKNKKILCCMDHLNFPSMNLDGPNMTRSYHLRCRKLHSLKIPEYQFWDIQKIVSQTSIICHCQYYRLTLVMVFGLIFDSATLKRVIFFNQSELFDIFGGLPHKHRYFPECNLFVT